MVLTQRSMLHYLRNKNDRNWRGYLTLPWFQTKKYEIL